MMKTNPRDLPPDKLLSQCRWETFRGPGPGGQNRNKTSSSVRVVHVPTGISATAGEFRSQQRNKTNALRRLRHRMAVELRNAVEGSSHLPEELAPFFSQARLHCSLREEAYPSVLGLVLDVIEANGGAIAESARQLNVTTGNLVGFLQRDDQSLEAVNRLRKRNGLVPLGGKI